TAARVAGRRSVRVVDGHGWLLGDEGSGFWLGREALRAVVRAIDGRGPRGRLVERVLEQVAPGHRLDDSSPSELIRLRDTVADWTYSRPPAALGALCPLVVGTAGEDPAARSLLDRAADELAEKVAVLRPEAGERLVTTGGLLAPGGPLTDRLAARLAPTGLRITAVRDGGPGAVALAGLLTR
ncbi:ATPase, partial [Streptomyces sp. 15-116A]|uniref:BadF/BadG/BcrA/BcrD ATPase family protein n=1 Tax=Streptomyces sp. 15-116A TaxID=2259035 RepID=UPI0037DA5291|nr:ATPase [Streptomyces sp. 15-116A]